MWKPFINQLQVGADAIGSVLRCNLIIGFVKFNNRHGGTKLVTHEPCHASGTASALQHPRSSPDFFQNNRRRGVFLQFCDFSLVKF